MDIKTREGEAFMFPQKEEMAQLGGVFVDLVDSDEKELILTQPRMASALIAARAFLLLEREGREAFLRELKEREGVPYLIPWPGWVEGYFHSVEAEVWDKVGHYYNIGFSQGRRLAFLQDVLKGLDFLGLDLQVLFEHQLARYVRKTPIQTLISEAMLSLGRDDIKEVDSLKGLMSMCYDYYVVMD